MAWKRVRDHKAEYARRNALAKTRGYGNRYEQRRKIETGVIAPIRPKQVKSRTTKAAQRLRIAVEKQAAKEKKDFRGLAPRRTRAERAEEWSLLMAKTPDAEYNPDDAKELGVTRTAYTNAYLAAFVLGPEHYHLVRHNGGSDALKTWFVDITHTYTSGEYDARYSITV